MVNVLADRKKWPLLIAGGCVLSLVLGLVRFSGEESATAALSDRWPVQVFEQELSKDALYTSMLDEIRKSAIFPAFDDAEETPVITDPTQDPDSPLYIPPFPEVISVSRINRAPRLHLRVDEDTIIYAGEGDVLDSGWELTAINLNRVVAVYNEIEHTFPITYSEATDDVDAENDEGDGKSNEP